MDKFDIDAYFDGTLSKTDLVEFEDELKSNPSFSEEVEMQQVLRQDLRTLGLRKKISESLSTQENSNQKRPFYSLLWLGLIVLLIGVSIYMYSQQGPQDKRSESISKTIEKRGGVESDQNLETVTDTLKPIFEILPSEKIVPKQSERKLIAKVETKEKEATQYQSVLRGQSGDLAEWQSRVSSMWDLQYFPEGTRLNKSLSKIDGLIKKNDFSKAYARIQYYERKNSSTDTLLFLKSYCSLALLEGNEALVNLEKLKLNSNSWGDAVEWNKAMGHLLMGNVEKSLNLLNSMHLNTGSDLLKKKEEMIQEIRMLD